MLKTNTTARSKLYAAAGVGLAAGIAIGFAVGAKSANGEQEVAAYCAAVVAGAHEDFRGLCPAGSFNSYRGLPGDIAMASCVTGEGC